MVSRRPRPGVRRPVRRFHPGQRVTATLYGVRHQGTVRKHETAIVWVVWDGQDVARWYHAESLTPEIS